MTYPHQTMQPVINNGQNNSNRHTNNGYVLRMENSPLVRSITEYKLHVRANILEILTYDGMGDPDDHI